MNILIITVGTRDVQINEEFLNKTFPDINFNEFKSFGWNARPFGKFLNENFDKVKEKISLPIIDPCLQYLKNNHAVVHQGWLVVTDQSESVGKVRDKDTLEFGAIIKKMIPRIFAFQNLTPKFKTYPVNADVTFLDSMYNTLSQSPIIKDLERDESYDTIYLLNQGGIDAINTSLLLNILKVAGKKLVHLSSDERSRNCFRINFAQKFIEESEIEKARSLVKHYNYAALGNLNLSDNVKKIAQYAHMRLQFDFASAINCLNSLTHYLRQFVIEQTIALDKMINNRDKIEYELVRELYFNARIKFEQSSYVDFLLRFFRIIEFFCQKQAIELLKIENYNFKKWSGFIQDFMLNDTKGEALKTYLSNQRINGNPLDFKQPVIPVFIHIMKFFNHSETALLEQSLQLTALRNKSIGAHDFQPVSLEKINAVLSESHLTIKEVFTRFDKLFDLDFEKDNPFNRINEAIFNELKHSS